jgi:hypothetical protein
VSPEKILPSPVRQMLSREWPGVWCTRSCESPNCMASPSFTAMSWCSSDSSCCTIFAPVCLVMASFPMVWSKWWCVFTMYFISRELRVMTSFTLSRSQEGSSRTAWPVFSSSMTYVKLSMPPTCIW